MNFVDSIAELERELDAVRAEAASAKARMWEAGKAADAAEAEVVRLRSVISAALGAAGNRWSEWGDRALSVADILESGLEDIEAEL